MQFTRLILKFKVPQVNCFLNHKFCFKYLLWNSYVTCSSTSSLILHTKSDFKHYKNSKGYKRQKSNFRDFSSFISKKVRTSELPESKEDRSFQPLKFPRRNIKKESIVSKSNDPDIFGAISDSSTWETLEERIGDKSDFHEDSHVFIPMDRKYRSPKDYLHGMKEFVREKRLKQALELLTDMKRHQVPPEHPHYTYLIGSCGRAGYTEMAFKLLKQMTDRGLKPSPATLTGLFNSCAECPIPDYGLTKANYLRGKIALKSWEITIPTYHAMIKAFGKSGDIKTAFEIVDEMVESGHGVVLDTYSMLLMSCISDKECGFTHVIEVWRKLISKKLTPKLFSYNLLLRAVRDCGVGPEEVACHLLQHWSSYLPRSSDKRQPRLSREDTLALPQQSIKLIGQPLSRNESESSQEKTSVSQNGKGTIFGAENDTIEVAIPVCDNNKNRLTPENPINLLSPRPSTSIKIIDFNKIKSPSDRLLLLGGVKGILGLMTEHRVVPDIKTFTMLLKIIPDSTEDEMELMKHMEGFQVKPDVDFFNILIKKRNFRKDFKAAKEGLLLITKNKLYPDIATFGVLALGCTRKKDGLQLLHDMKDLGLSPNIEIFGGLLNTASKSIDFEYVSSLLNYMKIERVKPSPRFLQMLEKIKNAAKEKILSVEQGAKIDIPFSKISFDDFCHGCDEWLKVMDVEETADPWLQYKTEITIPVKE